MKHRPPFIRHEAVYHAARQVRPLCLAPLSLTYLCWGGLKQTCPMERQTTGGYASQFKSRRRGNWLGCPLRMPALSSFKGAPLIGLPLVPHGKNDAHPNVCQGANRHAMALPLLSFAVVVVLGPRFLLGALPGKLVQGIAQRLDAGKALMHGGIAAALKGDWRGPSQGGDTFCIGIAKPIISP